jgi:hypothetical protein
MNDWCIPNKFCKHYKRDMQEQEDVCSHSNNKDSLLFLKRCEERFCPIKKDVHIA